MAVDNNKKIRVLEEKVQRLEKMIAELLAENKELKRRLGSNSTNSSMPPSSDKLGTKRTRQNNRKKKKRGAQKGHKPQLKELLPEDKITKRHALEPAICPDCGGKHFLKSDCDDLCNQFIDLPPVAIEVTQYLRPVRICATCKCKVYAPLPDDAPKHTFGPGVVAMTGILTGVLNTSKRKALMMINEVFNIPMSLGGLSSCEARLSEALLAPYEEALEHARSCEVGHADETSWIISNLEKAWLWVLGTREAVAFMIDRSRGQNAAQKLLGDFSGTLITDRWGGYNKYEGTRQICWAHLLRDFTAISEAGGCLGKTGKKLHALAQKTLHLRARVRDGTLLWKNFRSRVHEKIPRLEQLLRQGAKHGCPLGGKCRDILKHRDFLWTFVDDANVDPTNNYAESNIRPGVLWRKGSFGTQSERGARYVERTLTVNATCRLNGKSVIDFFRKASENFHQNSPIPSIIG